MRLLWINLVAMLIALSAFAVEAPNIHLDPEGFSSLQEIPKLQNEALKNDSNRTTQKTVNIAQDFIPIVLIAEVTDFVKSFVHYIPIHSLVRQKEYFLLI